MCKANKCLHLQFAAAIIGDMNAVNINVMC